ncbi:GNAT family N-acetyltransferase [Scytonema sp. NUACC21]
MELFQVKISTNRLLLLPISLKFKEEIFREFTPEITTYMYARAPEDITETEEFINQSLSEIKNGNTLTLMILKKDSQEFLGCTGIHNINSNINSKELGIGIWLKKNAQGNGYGLETIAALKKWADDNLDYEYLTYDVDKANIPSRKIPETLGGQIFREYDKTNLSGRVLNIVEYRIHK